MRFPSVGERSPRQWARVISRRMRVGQLVTAAIVVSRRSRVRPAVGPRTVHGDSVTHTANVAMTDRRRDRVKFSLYPLKAIAKVASPAPVCDEFLVHWPMYRCNPPFAEFEGAIRHARVNSRRCHLGRASCESNKSARPRSRSRGRALRQLHDLKACRAAPRSWRLFGPAEPTSKARHNLWGRKHGQHRGCLLKTRIDHRIRILEQQSPGTQHLLHRGRERECIVAITSIAFLDRRSGVTRQNPISPCGRERDVLP